MEQQPLDTISLADVTKLAGIPLGSVYHFFPSINALSQSVAAEFAEELKEELEKPGYQASAAGNWQEIIEQTSERVYQFYLTNPCYQQLILGGKAPPEIKMADRENDMLVGQLLIDIINRHFVLAEFPRAAEVFFNSTQIFDALASVSVIREGHITENAKKECVRAINAYLRVYLPQELPLRNAD